MKTNETYGVSELASFLGITAMYAHDLIRKGKIKSPKQSAVFGRGRILRRWTMAEMEAIKKSREK